MNACQVGIGFYYLYDGLGNVVGLTDSTGAVVNTYTYEPYGKTASSTGTTANPWRFGGSYGAYTENNSSGLLKIGQRFYDPSLGRWTQQDPVLHLGDAKQWNRYVYVACNPVNAIDPTGMDCSTASQTLAAAAANLAFNAYKGNELGALIGVATTIIAGENVVQTCPIPTPDPNFPVYTT